MQWKRFHGRGKTMASISLKHIYKAYPRTKADKKKEVEQDLSPFAVRDFNLEIQDGEFIVLVGPSGCGKSTTLRMIAGLEDITGGELYIGNQLCNNVDASKRNIAMVFQNYALYPHMTSYQNMSYGLKLRKIEKPVLDKDLKPVYTVNQERIENLKRLIKSSENPQEIETLQVELERAKTTIDTPKMKLVHYSKAEIDEKVQKAAEILDIKHLLDRKPSDMSGGQRQRVALGRALVRSPKVFLLDEPLSNLDAKLRASMRSEIVKLHNKVKTTFVYVTHDQVEAMTMGDRIVVMKDGVIQQVGTPSEIFDFPRNLFVAGFIGTPQMNFFNVVFKASKKDVEIILPNDEVLEAKVGAFREIEEEYLDGSEKSLVLGIRPEHILIAKSGIKATVNFVEVLGNTVNILCKLANSEIEFSITLQERVQYSPGDEIYIAFDSKNCHMFDREKETSIYKLEEK